MFSLPVATLHDSAAVATALREHGVCRLAGFPDTAAGLALADDLRQRQLAGSMRAAKVGHGGEQRVHAHIRGDTTQWLDQTADGSAEATYLSLLQELRVQLNQRLFLGAEEVHALYACYAVGAFYARHSDRFHDSDARVVSVVSYLNQDWRHEQGGALRLHLARGAVDVFPHASTSLCFLSEIEHEVLPATRERLSIAAWLQTRPH
jgi:SM-20-related protein